MDDRDIG